jgi:hypothetical protein
MEETFEGEGHSLELLILPNSSTYPCPCPCASGSNVDARCLEEPLAKTVFILSMIAALPELALFPIFGRPGADGDEDSELASRLPRDGESGLR